jgi:hypothetical protein
VAELAHRVFISRELSKLMGGVWIRSKNTLYLRLCSFW